MNLTEQENEELLRLFRLYGREVKRCQDAGAYLAGCVMASAQLEAALVLMVDNYSEEAEATRKCPTKKGSIKPLLEWNLGELLQVAKATGWLPSALDREADEWNSRRAEIGDYTEVVREIRNLVHPTRYAQDHYRKKITGKHLSLAIHTTDAVSDLLYAHIEKALLEDQKGSSRDDDEHESGNNPLSEGCTSDKA